MRSASIAAFLVAVATTVGLAQAPPGQAPPAAPPPPPPPTYKVGDVAPDFTLPYLVAKPEGGFERKSATLSEFKGKQNVVLAFFPAAFSPG